MTRFYVSVSRCVCLFVLIGNAVCFDVRVVVAVVVVDKGAQTHISHVPMLFSSIIRDRYLSVDCMKAFFCSVFPLFFLTHKQNYW